MRRAITGAVLVGLAVRLAMLAGAGEVLGAWVQEYAADGRLISATLNLELGGAGSEPPEPAQEEPASPETSPAQVQKMTAEEIIRPMLVTVTPSPSEREEEDGETEDDEPEIRSATISAGVSLDNNTGFDIDLEALAAEGLTLTLRRDGPQVLIVHTHSSEAYTQESYNRYEESDPYRTEDKNYSVVRVGDALAEKLGGYGLNVLHDREIYDYPSYTGSYSRSGAAVEQYLAQYPDIAVVIDLHRDALGSGDVVYKTKADLTGKSSAQVLFIVGTGENGLYHPNWRENLKLALYLQSAMDSRYPTLARPVSLVKERYNQHLSNGMLILEVGSTGNTLNEAIMAAELFGECAGPALAALIEPYA